MNKVLKALTITVLVLIIIAALAAVPNMIGKEIQTGTAVGYEWSANSPYEEQKTAKIEEGDKEGAEKIARAFASYAAAKKGKHVKIDYFAVSLPDLLVWEQDLDERNDAFCDYVNGLAEKILEEVRK